MQKQFSDRLFYEWQMLTRIAEKYESYPEGTLERNALEESGAVHCDCLRDALEIQYAQLHDTVFYQILYARDSRHLGENHPVNLGHYKWDFAHIADILQPHLESYIEQSARADLGDRWFTNLEKESGPRWDRIKQLIENKMRIEDAYHFEK